MASMIERIQPMLEPGEVVAYAVTGQTGVNPLFRFVTQWVVVLNKPRIIAFTDRRIVVFKAGQFRFARKQPKALLYSVPRQTELEHQKGSWSKLVVGDEKIWVARNTYAMLDKANGQALLA